MYVINCHGFFSGYTKANDRSKEGIRKEINVIPMHSMAMINETAGKGLLK
jgi:hypothetical protein